MNPSHFTSIQNNNISAVTADTFCKSNDTYYIRSNMNEIRMDGNPIILAQYPNSFTCLPSLPIGRYQWKQVKRKTSSDI